MRTCLRTEHSSQKENSDLQTPETRSRSAVFHRLATLCNANAFIVHVHPLQTNQLLKCNNFLHSKNKKNQREIPTMQRILEIPRMASGEDRKDRKDDDLRYISHLTQHSTKWRTEKMQSSQSCRLAAMPPGKPGCSCALPSTQSCSVPSLAQISCLLETRRAESLTLAQVPRAHDKCQRLFYFHYHHLSAENPAWPRKSSR